MTNSFLRYKAKADFKLDNASNVKQLMRLWDSVHYVGGVVPASERKSKASSGSVGCAGAETGQIVIYFKGEAQPICNAPFSAHGAAAVQYSA